MARVLCDPDELEMFTNALGNYIENIVDETQAIKAEHDRLQETWQDDTAARFDEDFDALVTSVAAFKDSAEDQIPYLRALVERIREYQEG